MLLQRAAVVRSGERAVGVSVAVLTSPSPYILRWYEIRMGRLPFLVPPSPTLTVGTPDWIM
jgi:hypothetical protein